MLVLRYVDKPTQFRLRSPSCRKVEVQAVGRRHEREKKRHQAPIGEALTRDRVGRVGKSHPASGERAQKAQPAYAVKQRTGPDHAPVFTVEVRIPGEESEQGEGSTKRDAEQDAARRMLLRLGLWKE